MSYLSQAELDIYKHPQYAKKIARPTHQFSQENILCGDKITIEIEIKNNHIIDCGYKAEGCVLNIVAAEKLMAQIINQPIDKLDLNPLNWLKSFNFEVPAGRQKCVLLSLNALEGILAN